MGACRNVCKGGGDPPKNAPYREKKPSHGEKVSHKEKNGPHKGEKGPQLEKKGTRRGEKASHKERKGSPQWATCRKIV